MTSTYHAPVPLDAPEMRAAVAARSVTQRGRALDVRLVCVRQILAAGGELGPWTMAKIARRLAKPVNTGPVEDFDEIEAAEQASRWAQEDADRAAAVSTGGQQAAPGIAGPSSAALPPQPAAATTSRQLSLSQAPVGSVLAEGFHWLAYASAAYELTVEGILNRLHAMGAKGLTRDHILYAELQQKPMMPAHFIARDEANKALVVAIRGTSTIRDVLADMAARPIPFAGGMAHTGMAAAVDGILHYKVNIDPVAFPFTAKLQQQQQQQQAVGEVAGGTAQRKQEAGVATTWIAASTVATGRPPSTIFTGSSAPSPKEDPLAFSVPFVQEMAGQRDGQLQQQQPQRKAIGNNNHGGGAGVHRPSVSHGGRLGERDPYSVLPPLTQMGVAGVALLLREALQEYPDHRVIVTGHSLGAGIAALLTMKLVRIVLHWRRQALESRQAIVSVPGLPPAYETSSAPVGESAAAGTTAGEYAAAPSTEATRAAAKVLDSLLPPRPLHCWAYAAPACMTPELSALSALSMAEMEEAVIDDYAFLSRLVGSPSAKAIQAQREQARKNVASGAEHEAVLPSVGEAASGERSEQMPAQMPQAIAAANLTPTDASAPAQAGPAGWPLLRKRPTVTTVVFGDDMVPRLTITSLKRMVTKLNDEPKHKRADSAASTSSGCFSRFGFGKLSSSLLMCLCCGSAKATQALNSEMELEAAAAVSRQAAAQQSNAIHPDAELAAAAAAGVTTASTVPADAPDGGGGPGPAVGSAPVPGAPPTASSYLVQESMPSISLSTDYSTMMQPLKQVEEPKSGPMLKARAKTEAVQSSSTVSAPAALSLTGGVGSGSGKATFETRLRAAAIPEAVVQLVLRKVGSLQRLWYDSSQQLVVPGCIYYIRRLPASKAAAEAADGPEAGPELASSGAAVIPAAAEAEPSPLRKSNEVYLHPSTNTAAMLRGGSPYQGPAERTEADAAASGSGGGGGARAGDGASVGGGEHGHPRKRGASATITVGADGSASVLRYRVTNIPPSRLADLVVSNTMATDHLIANYKDSLAALMPQASAPTAAAAGPTQHL